MSENVHSNPYRKRCLKPDEDAPKGPPAAAASASALVIAATDKAGMDGIDRARIDAIILRESGDSLYMKQQRKRDAKVDEKIAEMKEKLARQPSRQWRHSLQAQVDAEIPGILAQRPLRSTCVVVDMDMFYMACELLTRPDLADKPSCVGGSMILTSNYEARKYGVRSAMAGWIGDRLVSELSGGKEKLIHAESNFELYHKKSMEVREVLAEYDPHLRAYSLDEAYMDLGPYLALKLTKRWSHEQIKAALLAVQRENSTEKEDAVQDGSLEILSSFPPSVCMEHAAATLTAMRRHVKDATGGLTCSAGLGPNFLLAKMASDANKPDGQLLVGSDQDAITGFLYPMPNRKVSGIGRVTEKMLKAFDIHTVKDLYEERALVRFLFKPVTASSLLRASLGCSSRDDRISGDEDSSNGQKGISRERTFQPGKSWNEINSKLEDIGRLLSSDMQRKNLWAHTITVKVKLHTFDCLSRSRTMSQGIYLQNAEGLVGVAAEILSEMRKERKGGQFSVRLLGIRCSNFQNEEERSDADQMNIEKFLQRKPAANSPRAQSPSPVPVNPAFRSLSSPDRRRSTSSAAAQVCSAQASCTGEVPTVECPICQKAFREDENDALNRHVDACLSGSTVRKVVREESVQVTVAQTTKRSKKQRLTDFFELQHK